MNDRIIKVEMSEADYHILKYGTYIVSRNDITTMENHFVKNTKFKVLSIFHQKCNGYSVVHDALVDDELIVELAGPNGQLWITYNANKFWEDFYLLAHNIKRIKLFGYTIDIYKPNALNN